MPLSDFNYDVPHTISYAMLYRVRIDSFGELTKDKKPPRDLWDKPHKLEEFFDDIFDRNSGPKKTTYMDYVPDEVE